MTSWAKELTADHPYFGDSLSGIGQSYLGEGTPERALAPLERGLAIREKNRAEPSQISETQFLLAQALWDSGRDRTRAVALARSAKEGYGDRPWWRDKVGAIDRWLAGHPQVDEGLTLGSQSRALGLSGPQTRRLCPLRGPFRP